MLGVFSFLSFFLSLSRPFLRQGRAKSRQTPMDVSKDPIAKAKESKTAKSVHRGLRWKEGLKGDRHCCEVAKCLSFPVRFAVGRVDEQRDKGHALLSCFLS
ncbi:MAG: hypothetical protein BYD32DRAFT_426175 [Podila humilis]|nr:MAG: hypothetical protein BYD32DRAFT_426175 [Podila humilis]